MKLKLRRPPPHRGLSRSLESVSEAGYTDQANKPANISVLEVAVCRTF